MNPNKRYSTKNICIKEASDGKFKYHIPTNAGKHKIVTYTKIRLILYVSYGFALVKRKVFILTKTMVNIISLSIKMSIDFCHFCLSGYDTYFHLHNVEFTLLLVSSHS